MSLAVKKRGLMTDLGWRYSEISKRFMFEPQIEPETLHTRAKTHKKEAKHPGLA